MTRNHPETKTMESIKALNLLMGAQNEAETEKEKDILEQAIIRTNIPEEQNEKVQASHTTVADVDHEGKLHRYRITQRTVGTTRWHLCNYCTKEFRKPSDLVRHLRVHTREKPFRCKICNRGFAVKSTLTTHLKTHSLGEKKEWTCKICAKVFPTSNEFSDHMKKHQSYICKICLKTFRNVRLLKQHNKVHLSKEEVDKLIHEDLTLQEPIILTNKGMLDAKVMK